MSPHRSTPMMSAPSRARRTAWLRPWPRAAPVISATLPATRPGRVVGAALTRPRPPTPVVSVRRLRRRPRWPGPAAGLRARHRAPPSGPRNHRPAACPASTGRGTPRGGGGRSRRSTAHPMVRCSPVHTSSRRARPSVAERSSARSSRRTPACCRRVLASARSPVMDSRVPATWSWVTRATSTPAGGQPFGHPDPDRPADRVVDDHRPVGKDARSLARAAPAGRGPGTRRRRGRRSGTAGTRWPAPPRLLRARAVSRSAGATSTPVSRSTPCRRHSATSHSARSARRLAPRAHRRPPQRAPGPRRPAPPPAPGGRAAGSTRAHSRPATPAPTMSTSRLTVGPVNGGLDRLVAAAGLTHAAHHRDCGCPGPGRPGCTGCRAAPGAVATARPTPPGGARRSGPGSSPPGRRVPSSRAAWATAGSTTLPCSTTAARPAAASRIWRHSSRLKAAPVWASGR